MVSTAILNGFFFELPSLKGLFRLIRGKSIVQEQPVRIEFVATIGDGLAGDVGMVHAVHYPDETSREVFTSWEGGWSLNTEHSRFLKAGRKGKKYEDVQKVWDDKNSVPPELKKQLKAYQEKRWEGYKKPALQND